MGFFSWKTQDTNKSIPSRYSEGKVFSVVMIDDKGNQWEEKKYEGYGVFGGKDYYELLAEMNGITEFIEGGDMLEDLRGKGISLAFMNSAQGDNPDCLFPNLVESANGWTYTKSSPESCEYQGFFYEEEEENN